MDQVRLALQAMYSAPSDAEKTAASKYLEQFQKSEPAWETAHTILADNQPLEMALFAAQTLRAKVTYDLAQLPHHNYAQLRLSLLHMLASQTHRVVRTQLAIAVAQLALQDMAWQNPVGDLMAALPLELQAGTLLEALRILPEELLDPGKTPLTDAEFNHRTAQLITDNVQPVLGLLAGLAGSGHMAPEVLDCLNSWIKECEVEKVLTVTALTTLMFESLTHDDTFDRAVECVCTVIRETRDVDRPDLVEALYQQVLQLDTFMAAHPDKLQDGDTFDGLVRLYAEAGESWHVLVAKNPAHFRLLVEIMLRCAAYRDDLDVVKYTFYFWYLLKLLLTLPRFKEQRAAYSDVYESLILVILTHLTYPVDTPFDDKEQEDKFKEFRYEMGDVLKDCCAVVGATRALGVPFGQLQAVMEAPSPPWQRIEAPLFSMRTMAKEVSTKEKTILPVIMGYLVRLPNHPKVRYAATLVLGRYTEWTANNPQYLEPQLDYITQGFAGSPSSDIQIASLHALMYFCQDCAGLLVNYLEQLYQLYGHIRDHIDLKSHCELADGLGHVLLQVPASSQRHTVGMFWKPAVEVLAAAADSPGSPKLYTAIADQADVLAAFVAVLRAPGFDEPDFPVSLLFVAEVWPAVSLLLDKHGAQPAVSERLTKLLKTAIQLFSTYLSPILADIARLLHSGFQHHRQGCYLWVSGAVVREYGDDYTSDDTKRAVYQFALTQCQAFFEWAGATDMGRHPDVVEDFFRMANDILMYYPLELIPNAALMATMVSTSIHTMAQLDEYGPLVGCLHFLIDYVSWGLPHPPISFLGEDPVQLRATVRQFLLHNDEGARLLRAVMEGLIFRFHADLRQDASDLLLKTLTVVPDHQQALGWLAQVVQNLPNAGDKEVKDLLAVVGVALPNKDNRRVRTALRDFVNWYLRKNVTRGER